MQGIMGAMRLFFGPSDILHAATSVRDGVGGAVDDVVDLFELLGRATDLVGRAEELMTRAEGLVDRTELVVEEAATATRRASITVEEAATATRGAAALVAEADALMVPVRPLAAQALPIATTIIDSISEQEARAVVRAIDRLPQLVDSLEQDVLPLLGQLDKVGPDVHAILDSVTDLSHAIRGLPGMGLLQRRGERKDDEADEADENSA